MSAVIPVVWALFFLGLLSRMNGVRKAAVAAFTAVTVTVLVLTEVLSLVRALCSPWLDIAWVAVALAVAFAFRDRLRPGFDVLRERAVRRWDRIDMLCAAVVSAFALGTLLSAVLYPVTNFDSLTYHMPRVFFWFQNHTVAHYPTAEGRQLFSSALVEYFVLTLKVLSRGSDRLANVVQWASYVFSVATVSLIAEQLGASKRGQQLAAVTAALVPMAILQASTTQNDLTAALWSLVAVSCILAAIARAGERAEIAPGLVLWTAAALGLAYQSKPTAYLFTAPFLIWAAVALVRGVGVKRTAVLMAAVIAVVLALNAGWYARNAAVLGGDVLGVNAPGNSHILVKDRSPSALVTNALKNSSLMLGTPSATVNTGISRAVVSLVDLYHGDPENPRTKEDAGQSYEILGLVLNHNVGPGPLTMLTLSIAIVGILASRRDVRSFVLVYVLCAVSAFILVASLITWNYFTNRVLLGAVLLCSAFVGVALNGRVPTWRRILGPTLLGAVGLSLAWGLVVMTLNTTNRLVPPGVIPVRTSNRDLGYWNTSYDDLRIRSQVPMYEDVFKQIASVLAANGVHRIGIDQRAGNFPIYPLLAMLPDRQWGYVGTIAVPVSGATFDPQAVLEIVWKEDYPARASSPAEHGAVLLGPVDTGSAIFTVYLPKQGSVGALGRRLPSPYALSMMSQ